jgi:hypothetical protein
VARPEASVEQLDEFLTLDAPARRKSMEDVFAHRRQWRTVEDPAERAGWHPK